MKGVATRWIPTHTRPLKLWQPRHNFTTSSGDNPSLPVLIIGAGLAGLSLARVLDTHGVPYKVFESSPRNRTQGYGITFREWAYKPFVETIGCTVEQLIKASATDAAIGGRGAIRPSVLDVMTGDTLIAPPPAQTGASATRPNEYFRANRNTLREFLLRGLDVKFDHQFTSHSVNGQAGEVMAHFEGQKSVRGSLLIGADGVHSIVRQLLLPHVQPSVLAAGVCTGRRVVSRSDFDRSVAPWLQGSNVLVGVAEGVTLSITVTDITDVEVGLFWSYFRPAKPDPNQDSLYTINRQRDGTSKLFTQFLMELAQLPSLAEPFAHFFGEDLIRTDVPFNWLMRSVRCSAAELDDMALRQRVALIGDAAHAMPIFAGEGGNHALVDGVELGLQLARTGVTDRDAKYSESPSLVPSSLASVPSSDPLVGNVLQFYNAAVPRWSPAIDGSEKRLFELARPMAVWKQLASKMKQHEKQ